MITGKEIINAISRRLSEEDVRCYDSAIIQRLSELTEYDINELVTFGDLARWVADRNKKSLKSISREVITTPPDCKE